MTRHQRGIGKTGSGRLRGAMWITAIVASSALIGMRAAEAVTTAPGQLPTNGTVVSGQASISAVGAAMTVQQVSPRAILEWQSFNVGSAASVHFDQQQGPSSITLNRVLDGQPSQIFGRISAPGQVFLVNPEGAYFAPTASVDVGGLVTTTHAIADHDFLAGRYVFDRRGALGSIVNAGELRAALGGYIALLAPEVRNQGVILAQAGTAALAAGETFELTMQGQNTLAAIAVSPSTLKTLVDNRSAVIAENGLIVLSARAADQLQGSVINNSGNLIANSLAKQGGRVVLTADHITVGAGSKIDASGATGGGTVLIGGDWQGGNDIFQATQVHVAENATVDVSARQDGNGGKVVFWSDISNPSSLTEVHGSISARGAGVTGRGGQIETSGYRLSLQGIRIDASAPSGTGGEWLLDPADITIDDNPAVGDAPAAAISAALLGGVDVVVDTVGSPPCFFTCVGNGDIFINTAIDGRGGAPSGTLNIVAERDIRLASGVSIFNGNSVRLIAGRNQLAGNATGGNIVLGGGNRITAPLAVLYSGSPLETSLANTLGVEGGQSLFNLDPLSFAEPGSGIFGVYRGQPDTGMSPLAVAASVTGRPISEVPELGTSAASSRLLATLDHSTAIARAELPQANGTLGNQATRSKGKVREGLMVSPPPVKGFKRAYVVLLDNPDGSVGEIVVKGEKGEQVVSSSGHGVPLDGSALPQKVGEQLMEQDFSSARKAAAEMLEPQGNR